MKKLRTVLRYLSFSCLFCLTVIFILLIHFVFSTPEISRQDLPSNLISNESVSGKKLLAESNFDADYLGLRKNFVSQSRIAFCGVASSVIALNTIRKDLPRVTQANIFNSEVRQVVQPLKVTFGGMTLAQLNGILQARQLDTVPIYAADINLEQFRSLAKENLNNPDDVILVNYRRPALNQPGGGHISPIAAYHQQTDRFLILDVAAYKYPATWVKTEELWNGMNSLDRTSNRSRGLIFVRS